MAVAYLTPARRKIAEYVKTNGPVKDWPTELLSGRRPYHLFDLMVQEGWLSRDETLPRRPAYSITEKGIMALDGLTPDELWVLQQIQKWRGGVSFVGEKKGRQLAANSIILKGYAEGRDYRHVGGITEAGFKAMSLAEGKAWLIIGEVTSHGS